MRAASGMLQEGLLLKLQRCQNMKCFAFAYLEVKQNADAFRLQLGMYYDAAPLFAGNSLCFSLDCCSLGEELGPCAATGFLRLDCASEIQSQDLAWLQLFGLFKTSTKCMILDYKYHITCFEWITPLGRWSI